jgi:hypothetical protein
VLLHGLNAHQQRHRQVQEQSREGIRFTVLASPPLPRSWPETPVAYSENRHGTVACTVGRIRL